MLLFFLHYFLYFYSDILFYWACIILYALYDILPKLKVHLHDKNPDNFIKGPLLKIILLLVKIQIDSFMMF